MSRNLVFFYVFWRGNLDLAKRLGMIIKAAWAQKLHVFMWLGHAIWTWPSSWAWSARRPGRWYLMFFIGLDTQAGSGQAAGSVQQGGLEAETSCLICFGQAAWSWPAGVFCDLYMFCPLNRWKKSPGRHKILRGPLQYFLNDKKCILPCDKIHYISKYT